MSCEDSELHRENKLQDAGELEMPGRDAAASNEAGPSGASETLGTRDSVEGEVEDGACQVDSSLSEMEEEVSDSDMDTEESSLATGHLLSPNYPMASRKKGDKIKSLSKSQQSKRPPGRGKRGNRGKVSIEEMIKRQETASQVHNEHERVRRKELRGALLGLRNQLTRPTKRPAVKLVLEAAIQELTELKRREKYNAKLVESLKDNEKRLQFELENKIKEFKKHQEQNLSLSPTGGPSITHGLQTTPTIPNVQSFPGTVFPFNTHLQTPDCLRSDSSALLRVNPPVPMSMLFPWQLRHTAQHLTSPTLHPQFRVPAMLPNISPSLLQTPVLTRNPPLNLTPQPFPTLYPFRSVTLPAQSYPTFPARHSSLSSLQRIALAAAGQPPNTAPVAKEPHQFVAMDTLKSHGISQTSASRASMAEPEDRNSRTPSISADSSPVEELEEMNTDNSDRGQRHSKNGGESADTGNRPFSVMQYTTSADSKQKWPAQKANHDMNLVLQRASEQQLSSRCNQTDDPLTIKITEHPTVVNWHHNLQRTSHILTRKKAQRVQRCVPPLLRIENDNIVGAIHNTPQNVVSKVRAHAMIGQKLGSKISQINNSNSCDIVKVQYCKNPHYNTRSSVTRTNLAQMRRSSTTDSESSEEESNLSTSSYSHYQTRSIAVTCPGD